MISRGSQWRRWEPHIHAPGTLLNDQFGGDAPWGDYLSKIETLSPQIEALAVTDYYVTDTYEEVLRHKKTGRLAGVQLIFPNVELRLDIAAKKGFVNIHLLVSPEDPEHLVQLHRLLGRLEFGAHGDRFACTKNDLIALGKKSDPTIKDDLVALRQGATQFKVNFDALRKVFHESDWARANVLIAVAGGSGDGTAGVRQASDATIRQEIEKFAHIIFSSSAPQREFWLGQRDLDVAGLKERYNGCKPCLHGSDAHETATVGVPTGDRYSWIKGSMTFDSLRQACIDPSGRAYVGTEPPNSPSPSQIISTVSVTGADWALTPTIPLNSGLVAVIGARGSGKTALADMIAAACDAVDGSVWLDSERGSPSFLARARPLMKDAACQLTWGGGEKTERRLDGRDSVDSTFFARARYLSQQFVEELCSTHGIADGLISEIERVILEAHPVDDREGTFEFNEFRELRTGRFRQARERETEAISELSERIATELEKDSQIPALMAQVSQKKVVIQNYDADLKKIVLKGTEAFAKRHGELDEVATSIRERVNSLNAQRRTFTAMKDEVTSTRITKAPELLRQARERHNQSGLNDDQWEEFLLIYKGDVDIGSLGPNTFPFATKSCTTG
ncbi:hypothetical protein Jab_2c19310 [Janthinobacterium sp. HH01]|nr:hypothetical protein Jab_2c19310 [Janthinobacterium sp. HH01]